MSLVPMKKEKYNILIVDDDEDFNFLVTDYLQKCGYKVDHAYDAISAKTKLKEKNYSLILLDLRLPPSKEPEEGINLFKDILQTSPETKVIILSGSGQKEHVIHCIKNGAYDYIEKSSPDIYNKVEFSTERALQLKEYEKIVKEHQNEQIQRSKFGNIIGKSKKMQKIYKTIEEYADSDENILLLGETGSGKNLFAQTIHDVSNRAKKQFVYLNCASINPSLIESELFGHEKGSFSGAYLKKIGIFEAANYGTLFLDEIAEINYELQAKLLDAIEMKTIRKVGSVKNIQIDVRIIAATNKNIKKLIQENKFREDLYQRLNIYSIEIPPLRERIEDIKIIGEYLFNKNNKNKCKSISNSCFERLKYYSFPGNIREYESIIKELIMIAKKDDIIDSDMLNKVFKKRNIKVANKLVGTNLKLFIEKCEQKHIEDILQLCNGKKVEAAKLLDITRQGLDKKIKKYKIQTSKTPL